MKRPLHLAIALVAAIMHLGAPAAAYAAMGAQTRPADFCSVASTVATSVGTSVVTSIGTSVVTAGTERSSPAPVSHEHHCAHAPCCAGGAVDAAAPPPVVSSILHISLHRVSAPAAASTAVPVPPIAAAQPRGPPSQA